MISPLSEPTMQCKKKNWQGLCLSTQIRPQKPVAFIKTALFPVSGLWSERNIAVSLSHTGGKGGVQSSWHWWAHLWFVSGFVMDSGAEFKCTGVERRGPAWPSSGANQPKAISLKQAPKHLQNPPKSAYLHIDMQWRIAFTAFLCCCNEPAQFKCIHTQISSVHLTLTNMKTMKWILNNITYFTHSYCAIILFPFICLAWAMLVHSPTLDRQIDMFCF